ncbi:MAG: hypothetical protein DI598_20450, partial [Pseudopedobacter saltans]
MSYKHNQKAPAMPKKKAQREFHPFAGKKLVQVEKGTSVYVPKDATQEEVNAIVASVRQNLERH